MRLMDDYGNLPMSFEPNLGQAAESVKFVSRGSGYGVFLTSTGAVLTLSKGHEVPALRGQASALIEAESGPSENLRMQFAGANQEVEITGDDELEGKINYLRGKDPQLWRTNVPTYKKVRYRNVYSGIDLLFYGRGLQMEYDFVVAPGANPNSIRLDFQGAEGVSIDDDGNVLLQMEGHAVQLLKPVVYQEVYGQRQEIAAQYLLVDAHEVAFTVGKYDVRKPLVIDPVLAYSTFLGGSGPDSCFAIAVDSFGNAYVTGNTWSTDFPTAAPFQAKLKGGPGDVYVSKLNAAGTALVYSTYLGGSSDETGYGIAVDTSGNAYVTGVTRSADFPTVNSLQAVNKGGSDAFVSKLNATGTALVYSTYLGGSSDDTGYSIAIDSSGNAYVTGATSSTNFPTANPLQAMNKGGGDAFVSKLDAAGTALVYSTYLGGSSFDGGSGIALDASGNAYLIGSTSSTDFPTAHPLQAAYRGNFDAFITKVSADGSALLYSTYLGGSGSDRGTGIAIDTSGSAYVTGYTSSSDFPTASPFQAAFGGGPNDSFVSRLNASGSALVYSTYLGGSGDDDGYGIAVDSSGNAYVTGRAAAGFPLTQALQRTSGGSDDVFVSQLNAGGSALLFSTYLGGNQSDFGLGIAVGDSAIYVTGYTQSTNFPTANALQPNNNGNYDAVVVKIGNSRRRAQVTSQ